MTDRRRTKDKLETRLPAESGKMNFGKNGYGNAPDYYYDEYFNCIDCGKEELWTAKQQKWWYEEKQAYYCTTAIRCSQCRAHVNALKEEQKRHMDEMANKPKHPNEKFFKNT